VTTQLDEPRPLDTSLCSDRFKADGIPFHAAGEGAWALVPLYFVAAQDAGK